jgi:hypothetical protein
MHCTEWPCGARARSPSRARSRLVMRRPRMPPAGPRGGASTLTSPSRVDAMAVWRSSTVAEQSELTARDEETANAPGRPEGRCEHPDLAVARRRDPRLGVCCVAGASHDGATAFVASLTRDGRLDVCRVGCANHTAVLRASASRDVRLDVWCVGCASQDVSRRGSPLGPAGRFVSTSARPASTRCSRWTSGVVRSSRGLSAAVTSRVRPKALELRGRMHCTEWPYGARARLPSRASSRLVMRRPRMPPAGPRGGASTLTSQSRADAMAVWRSSTVAEQSELTARDEEITNAPGRPEGRCEHPDLASRADAILASTSAAAASVTRGARGLAGDGADATAAHGVRRGRVAGVRRTVNAGLAAGAGLGLVLFGGPP